uniref:C-X-C motif chemokine n=1 Tax=Felis catus TaxID=9685 RepID=A0ABI7YVZ0_FELCA
MKKSGIPLLLSIIFLTLLGGQGTLIMRNRRCFCINTSQGTIHLKSLKDLKQFAPSPSCEKTEIIVTMKNGDQTCLNPDSADVQELIKEWEKQNNVITVRYDCIFACSITCLSPPLEVHVY